jgi:RecB family exonuclease
MVAVSTDEPLWREDDGHVVTLSPSSLQTLIDCPLRWLVERYGGTDRRDLRSAIGSLLHTLVAEPDAGAAELVARLDRVWDRLPFDARWYAANELARHRAMLETFAQWRAATRHQLTEVGVEVDVDGVIDGVRLRGRVDRVERDAAGRVVVVDVKTGKTPVSKDDAQRHAQLAMYQLAVADGLSGAGDEPGGARLVYLGKPGAAGATERQQDPLTSAAADTWREVIRHAAAATAGPWFVARVNDGCRHCPLRSSCPAHTERTGR